jgi:sRNA-binding carbon storage regulator CsrA
MLTITVITDESFILDLGDGRVVEIKCIVRSGRHDVKLLVTAPESVRLWREKIWAEIVSKKLEEATV